MREIAIFLDRLALIPVRPHLYSRQKGQVPFANVWDFRTVGSARSGW